MTVIDPKLCDFARVRLCGNSLLGRLSELFDQIVWKCTHIVNQSRVFGTHSTQQALPASRAVLRANVMRAERFRVSRDPVIFDGDWSNDFSVCGNATSVGHTVPGLRAYSPRFCSRISSGFSIGGVSLSSPLGETLRSVQRGESGDRVVAVACSGLHAG